MEPLRDHNQNKSIYECSSRGQFLDSRFGGYVASKSRLSGQPHTVMLVPRYKPDLVAMDLTKSHASFC